MEIKIGWTQAGTKGAPSGA